MENVIKQNSIRKTGLLLECYSQIFDLARMIYFNGTQDEIMSPKMHKPFLKNKEKPTDMLCKCFFHIRISIFTI